jgi:hypothetical protein
MNPIKTPQEMLAEMAGIPHMAGGSSVGQFANKIADAIAKYKRVYGKAPTPEEVKGLEKYVSNLSNPTGPTRFNASRLAETTPAQEHLVDNAGRAYRAVPSPRGLTTPEQAAGYTTDPFANTGANFRAREGLYDDKVKAFESRDPFLTQAMTGRPPSGTRQKPFTANIDDLVAQNAALESKGIYTGSTGTKPGDLPTQSTTPSADYFASMSSAMENEALPENLVSVLRQKLGRQPTEDEINSVIADLNVLGMDYTGMGASVFGKKPAMPKGRPTKQQQAEIDAWRRLGIDSGQSRSAVDATSSDLRSRYPSLQREVDFGPEPGMKQGGSTSAEQMRHMMLASGKTPQKFAAGGKPSLAMLDEWTASQKDPYDMAPKLQAYKPGMRERATDAIAPYLEKMGMEPRRAYEQASAITGKDTLMSPATIFDVIAPFEAAEDLAKGNPVGTGLSLAGFIPGAAAGVKALKKTKKLK